MPRTPLPQKSRDAVLREYNHRCAVCGSDRPQIHHIDEDATNNDVANLLPLCPNCHLRDQHSPADRIDIPKLKLFRQYRDPGILKPQFHPIYKRQLFLDRLDQPDADPDELLLRATELMGLVSLLDMGRFYSDQLYQLLNDNDRPIVPHGHDPNDPKFQTANAKWRTEYIDRLRRARPQIRELIVELLCYQPWANDA